MAARRETVDGLICGEVDGVPAFWLPERKGPAAALLMFRVGQADETLPTRGATHLVEHLALVPSGRPPHDFNGQTGPSITSFGMAGRPAELVEFFGLLGTSLRDLPQERLETERTVLKTEEQGRGHGSLALWALRWGPQGFGLIGYDELGVPHLSGDQLQAWADQWFVRQNAALVLNGPPPRGLRLGLPEGRRAAPPVLGPAIDRLPASFTQQPPSFGLSYLRTRSAASGAAAWLLQERVNRVLRTERGVVYGVDGGTTALTAELRHDVLWTQAVEERLDEAATAFLEVLTDDSPLSPAEKKAWTAQKRTQRETAESIQGSTGWAAYLAETHLLGGDRPSFEAFDQEARRLREPELLAALAGLQEELLLALPAGVDPSPVATPVVQFSASRVVGRTLAAAHGQVDALVLGQDGISSVSIRDDHAITVHFDRCAGVLAWDDGARTLFGADGFSITYRPEQWKADADDVSAAVDRAVGPSLLIPAGARTPRAAPAGSAPPEGFGAKIIALDVALAFLALVMIVLGVGIAIDPGDPSVTVGERLISAVFFLALGAALLFLPCRHLWKGRHARRP